jgi:hypothetical protein
MGTDLNERDLIEEGLDRLQSVLGADWSISPVNYASSEGLSPADIGNDLVVSIAAPDSGGTSGPILIEVKRSLTPAGVRHLVPRLDLMQRLTGNRTVLVISQWLSAQTRAALDERHIGYLDLTGNVSFRLRRPGLVLQMQGSSRAPTPELRPSRSLRGDKAGALVRVMVDFAPPYRATQLAGATGLSLPYVTRLLETMEQQALIERRDRIILDVDWPRLLRARSAVTDLLNTKPIFAVAPGGPEDFLRRLADMDRALESLGPVPRPLFAITGPAAAEQVSPVTGEIEPVMVYLATSGGTNPPSDVNDFMNRMGLLPTRHARSNVWLLSHPSPYVFARMDASNFPIVANSQIALDCLSGPGRMPAQGDAVIDAMKRSQGGWRKKAEFLPKETVSH